MKKLLVTGISGFLGWHVARFPQKNWKLFGVYNQNPLDHSWIKQYPVNLADMDALQDILRRKKFDAILHLAANSKPNACEQDQAGSYTINVVAPTLIAEFAREHQIPYIFVSSDLVFDGETPPYSIDVAPEPVNVYGKQKAEAEERVLEIHPEATVARLPLLYDINQSKKSFLHTAWKRLRKEKKVDAFTDEVRTPLSGDDAAMGLFWLLDEQLTGKWHLGGRDALSRYELCLLMAKVFKLPEKHLVPVTLADLAMDAARPRNVSLDSQASYAKGFHPLSTKDALKRIKSLT